MALIDEWLCNDTAIGVVVVNTVNAARNGVLVGSTTDVKTVAGPGGTYLLGFDMDGTDDYVDITASTLSWATNVALSVSMWFSSDAQLDPLIGITAGSNSRIAFTTATGCAVTSTSVTSNTFTTAAIGTGWNHLLVTRDTSNNMNVYLNGVASVSNPLACGGTIAYGVFARRNTVYHNGKIAGVRIYDTNESANVATLFNLGKPQNSVLPSISGTFEDGETLTLADGTYSDGTTTARQWRVADDASGTNAANISGATGTTYDVDSGDISVGEFIGCRVTRANTVGSLTYDTVWTEIEATASLAKPEVNNLDTGIGIGL